jgi:hypothetical protein
MDLGVESCVADAAFERDLARNGTRNPNGTYSVAIPLVGELQRLKLSKIEECRLPYSK